jgi:hypothetical protein
LQRRAPAKGSAPATKRAGRALDRQIDPAQNGE